MKIGEIRRRKSRLSQAWFSPGSFLAAWSRASNNRRPFLLRISPIFTGCKASGMAAFFHNSALSCKGQRQAQALALCASLGLLPSISATGGGGMRPRRARKRQKSSITRHQSLASNSGNNACFTHQVTSAAAGPGDHPLARGTGAAQAPASFLFNLYNMNDRTRKV